MHATSTRPIKFIYTTLIMIFLVFSFPGISLGIEGELFFQLDQDGFASKYDFSVSNRAFQISISPWVTRDHDSEVKLGLSEAFLDLGKENFTFSLGRKIITYGPGRYGYPMLGPLGNGPSAEGYDQIGYSFGWGNLRYHKFYALVSEEAFRSLLGQRTTYRWRDLTLGFSETALLNSDTPGYFYQPLPFIPVYFLQFLGYRVFEIPGVNDTANLAMDFDITWDPRDDLRLYVEYFIDDRPWPKLEKGFQITVPEWDAHPWRVGYQAGGRWQEPFGRPYYTLYAEYTRINQFTYTGVKKAPGVPSELTYTYQGRIMGDPLGPDADRFNIELASSRPKTWQWRLAYEHLRRGEGKIGDDWETKPPGSTEVFLTGIVAVTDSLALTVSQEISGIEYLLGLALQWTRNADHEPHKNEYTPQFTLAGRMRFN